MYRRSYEVIDRLFKFIIETKKIITFKYNVKPIATNNITHTFKTQPPEQISLAFQHKLNESEWRVFHQ